MEQLISIVVPVYNVENYLKRCVDSLIRQTYRSIEIVLVDDGSSDGSGKLCDCLSIIDNRIKVVHKNNGGLSDARNTGTAVAQADIIAYVDSDDWVENVFIEKLYNRMLLTNADIVVGGVIEVHGSHFIKQSFYNEDKVYSSGEALHELCLDRRMKSYAWNKLYKRKVLVDFPKGELFEDVCVMHSIFKKADRIAIMSDYLNYYYMRDNSIVNSKNNMAKLAEAKSYMRRYKDLNNAESLEALVPRAVIACYKTKLTAKERSDNKELLEELRAILTSDELMAQFGRKRSYMARHPHMYRYAILIKNILPKRLKLLLRSRVNAVDPQMVERLDNMSHKKRIIHIGVPEYGNLGDIAIALATRMYIRRHSDREYIGISENEYNRNHAKIDACINDEDVLVLQGGGNLGSEYKDQERIRSRVIKAHPDNRIILFPQTIYFADNRAGKRLSKRIKRRYSKNRKLIIFTREQTSYNIASNLFSNRVCITPDIVAVYDNGFQKSPTKGILMLLRDDVEGMLDIEDLQNIRNAAQKCGTDTRLADTVIDGDVDMAAAKKVIDSFFRGLGSYSLVITDRLHGMIFCAVLGIPCLVIGNYNHKIKSEYQWFRNLGYIRLVDNVKDTSKLKVTMKELLQLSPKDCVYDKKAILREFAELKEVLIE